MAEKPPGRRILLLRHGERVDRVFTTMKDWVDRAFMPYLVYKRLNLNMPRVLPLRSVERNLNYDVADYNFDVPLTAIGEGAAEALGYHTSYSSWKFTTVYSSPALRCLQTVNRYLTGFKNGGGVTDHLFPLKIEPGFFDFTGFTEYIWSGIPIFLNHDWMNRRGILMSANYTPAVKAGELTVDEKMNVLYGRVDKALKHVLKENTAPHPKFGPPSILIATHAPVVDTACQLLLGLPRRDDERMKNVANYLKYIGTLAFEETSKDKWRMIPPPVRTFRYSSNEAFQYKKVFKDAVGGIVDEED